MTPPEGPPPRASAATRLRAASSLQARITAAILATVVLVLLMGCSLFMLEQYRSEQASERRRLQDISEAFAPDLARAAQTGDRSLAGRQILQLVSFDRVVGAELRTPEGRLVAAHRRRADDVAGGSGGESAFRVPLRLDGRPAGLLVIASDPPAAAAWFSRYVALGAALFFAATAAALFLGRWLAGRITTPLTRLAQAMETVGQSGAFQIRVAADTADEVGRLTQRFNILMDRLQVKDAALRHTLNELVEARDAAETANVAKSQFLANMSHEIRTPLNGVLAMAQILKRSPLEPLQRDQVEVIHQSGETLLSLLNDILDVSKIEAGKLELEAVVFDPQAVAAAAVAAFAPVAERKGLGLRLETAPDASGLREGDPARLRQILNNFLSNALKFTEAGEVRLHLSGRGPAGVEGLKLEVIDTGMGIAPDKLPFLFQKFTQLDASTTRRFGGTGLGLAICRELAEMMGGEIDVDSEAGRGSVFAVTLPLRRVADALPAEEATPAAAVAEAPGPGPTAAPEGPEPAPVRVLAAEDNPTNQLVLTTIMQIFGVELMLAGDGEEAVQRWREGRFDLILMDIQMPRLDGVAATRRIRAEEQAEGRARTPIVALSANALTHQVEAYLAAGMDGHVAKPIELDKLQVALEVALGGGGDPSAAAVDAAA